MTAPNEQSKQERSIYHILFMKTTAAIFVGSSPLVPTVFIMRLLMPGHLPDFIVLFTLCTWTLMVCTTWCIAMTTPYDQMLGDNKS